MATKVPRRPEGPTLEELLAGPPPVDVPAEPRSKAPMKKFEIQSEGDRLYATGRHSWDREELLYVEPRHE